MEINDHIDHQRWLIDNGFINDLHKDNLYAYGAIVHKDVKAVELHVDAANKVINYEIFVDDRLLKKLDRFKKLSKSTSIIDLWFLRRLLKKEGNLNFQNIIATFVTTYLGPKWKVSLNVKDFKDYDDSGYQSEEDSGPAQQFNSR
jgi:hypothetical protein